MAMHRLAAAKSCVTYVFQAIATRFLLLAVGLVIIAIGLWNPAECMRRLVHASERLAK